MYQRVPFGDFPHKTNILTYDNVSRGWKLRLFNKFGTNEIEIRKPHPHVVISCIPQCSSVAGDRLSLELKFKPLVCTANENLKNRFIPLNISKTLHCQTQQHSGPLCEGKQRCFNRANSVAENSSYQKKKSKLLITA